MRYLKFPYAFGIVALALTCLLSACDKEQTVDKSREPAVIQEVSAPTMPAKPQAAEKRKIQAESPSPAAEERSAASLKLTIMDTPYEETSLAGGGNADTADWSEREGHAAELGEMPINDSLLPDLFITAEQKKSTSVEMDVLLDDSDQEVGNVIDGAGLSIIHNTD